jgi:hypothetical protein
MMNQSKSHKQGGQKWHDNHKHKKELGERKNMPVYTATPVGIKFVSSGMMVNACDGIEIC